MYFRFSERLVLLHIKNSKTKIFHTLWVVKLITCTYFLSTPVSVDSYVVLYKGGLIKWSWSAAAHVAGSGELRRSFVVLYKEGFIRYARSPRSWRMLSRAPDQVHCIKIVILLLLACSLKQSVVIKSRKKVLNLNSTNTLAHLTCPAHLVWHKNNKSCCYWRVTPQLNKKVANKEIREYIMFHAMSK